MSTIVTVESLNTEITGIKTSLDAGWTMIAGILVFFMQAGFSLLESGMVRKKNTLNIIMKNIIDVSVGAVGWWLVGYALAFGESGEIFGHKVYGTSKFAMLHRDLKTDSDGSFLYAFWFFQFTFCATAATIVSGALAERCKVEGYVIFSFVMSVLVYPVVVHWTWGGGWLSEEGYSDFAGSGVVHMTGGVAALVGASVLGPRIGRFDEELGKSTEFAPTNLLNVCLGTFILWFGWYGFNAGSTTALSGSSAEVAGHCAVTTTLSAACGGIMSFALFSIKYKKYDLGSFANGILAGLVSITAGCANVDTHAAVFIGLIGGAIVFAVTTGLEALGFKSKVQIDDPISAFAVHGASGMWGVLAVGLFDLDLGMVYGNDFADCMRPNLYGIFAITLWVVITTTPLFLILKSAGILRVSEDEEKAGLDSKCLPTRPDTPAFFSDMLTALPSREVVEKDNVLKKMSDTEAPPQAIEETPAEP